MVKRIISEHPELVERFPELKKAIRDKEDIE
jgi:hypothetical protein